MDNKKRKIVFKTTTATNKIDCNEKDEFLDPSDLMGMLHLCIVQQSRTKSRICKNQDLEPPPNTTTAVRKRIIELKDQIDRISTMKQMISKFEETIDVELNGLYNTFSPLLSLGRNTLSQIMDFLDPEALHSAQDASYSLNQIIFENGHWERLGIWCQQQTNQLPATSNEIPARFFHRPPPFSFFLNKKKDAHPGEKMKNNKGILVAQARYSGAMSAKARYFETLGEKHFSSKDLSQGLTKSSNRSNRNFPYYDVLNEDSSHKAFETMEDGQKLFVRLTLYDDDHKNKNVSRSTKLIWQGFLDWSRMNEFTERCENAASLDLNAIDNLDWPGLKELLKWRFDRKRIRDANSSDDDSATVSDPEMEDRFHSFFKCLQVTVLVNQDQALVVSRGCLRADERWCHTEAYLRCYTKASLVTGSYSDDNELRLAVNHEDRITHTYELTL